MVSARMTKSPVLPAAVLATKAYEEMFKGNDSLMEVTCLATDISATGCVTGWLADTSATGTFRKASSMSSWPSGASGIPSGWTVVDYVE